MNVKEAMAEIEKRYKVGDKIACLDDNSDILDYKGVEYIKEIGVIDDVIWVVINNKLFTIRKNGEWSETIREEKNLWNFFNSIEDKYPDVVEKYLRSLDFYFTIEEGLYNLILGSFDWEKTKEGYDYWDNINDLYSNYLED